MESHKRFVKIAATDSTLFEIVGETPVVQDCINTIITKNIEECLQRIKAKDTCQKNLTFLRLLLCQQYKLHYEQYRDTKLRFHTNFDEFVQFLIHTKLYMDKTNHLILSDVMVLQLVLLEDRKNFVRLLEDFRATIPSGQSESEDKIVTHWYLKVLTCFLEAWQILYFLSDKKDLGVANRTHLESCKKVLLSSIMYDLQTWVKCESNDDWHALNAVVSSIVNIAETSKILSPYVHEILDKHQEIDSLTHLCVLSDYIFPSDTSNIKVDYNLIHHDSLWLKISDKIRLGEVHERKQAFYLLKKCLSFIDENEKNIEKAISLNLALKESYEFVCSRADNTKYSMKNIRTNYILVMEALDEKQKHLIVPSLSLVDDLIEGSAYHKSCGNCFPFYWILALFEKLLKHDNHSIFKWGLLKCLKINDKVCMSYALINLVINSMNNTFLYEKYNNETEPEVVSALASWFNFHQGQNDNLIEHFVFFFKKVSWGPVPIFYVIQALLSTEDRLINFVDWQNLELGSVKKTLERTVKLHPPMLRSMTQVALIKMVCRFSKLDHMSDVIDLLISISEKDVKEPRAWSVLTSWMAQDDYNDTVEFISNICDQLITNDENLVIPISTLAILIQLFYEGGLICQTKQCIATRKLKSLFLNLDKIDARPYVKMSFIIKVIDLLYSLLNLERQPPDFIYALFISYKETIFKFILKLFHSANYDYEDVYIFIKALQNINCYIEGKINNTSVITNNNKKELEEKCIQVITNAHKHKKMQILLALHLWSNISSCYKYGDTFFSEKVTNLLKMLQSHDHQNEVSGKVGLDFYVVLSKLIRNHILTLDTDDLKQSYSWLDILSSILDASGNELLIYFGDIVRRYCVVAANDLDKLQNFKPFIKSFWCCNFGSKRDKIFWSVSQKLTECINSSDFLNHKVLQEISQEFTDRMLKEGESLPGLIYILLACSDISEHFYLFMPTILNGILHGPVMRRDQRINLQTCIKGNELLNPYKLKGGKMENFDAYEFLIRQPNVDAVVRATAVLKLSKVLHTNSESANIFLPLVLEKLLAVQNKRYYADSQMHRLKHRIMQTLLLLQPYLDKDSCTILYHALKNSLIYESDQHSVRLMKEWLLVRLYLNDESLQTDLWPFFDKICEERPGSASSIISIIWHTANQISKDKLVDFIGNALKKIGVCCMGQQFGMRLFGQVFFVKLYEKLEENCDIRLEYKYFYNSTVESLRFGNLKKNLNNVDEDFFYTTFDPIKHYSLETIYHQLPRLSNVSFEEWIVKENFEEQILLDNLIIGVQVSNTDYELDKAVIPISILKSSENSKPEEIDCSQVSCDMQKKIIPWKSMLPNEEELSQFSNLTHSLDNSNKKDIIVIASLIDKPQNLGGIARTCEIFGVKELVISSLKLIEDKEFQVLSVSADKWIKMTEVKPFLLPKYLTELKDSGWNLIGAEQTANSVSLCDFKFPKRTVLVLGNEKNGVPANIIPLLDTCIEIPQIGVIRSLNVHVTSAICIWEYVKQYQS